MASTYTTNTGIEKIGVGEQFGTWGSTTNTNFDIIDQALNGVAQVTISAAGSSGSPNLLPITDGAESSGRNAFIEFIDGGDLGADVYVKLTPEDAEKIGRFRNTLSGSRSIFIFQGNYSSSNDYEIKNGDDVVLHFDGAGVGAVVTNINQALRVAALGIDGLVSEAQYSLSGTVLDPANGTIQYITLGSNTTFTESFGDGQYMTLMINDGSDYTVTWPTITWVGGTAPTLDTSGFNIVELWKVNSVLYGASVGVA